MDPRLRRYYLSGYIAFAAALGVLAWLLGLLPAPADYVAIPVWGAATAVLIALASELIGLRSPAVRGFLITAAFVGVAVGAAR